MVAGDNQHRKLPCEPNQTVGGGQHGGAGRTGPIEQVARVNDQVDLALEGWSNSGGERSHMVDVTALAAGSPGHVCTHAQVGVADL